MIHGHEKEKNFLKEWLVNEKRGVLILSGPEGVGKFNLVKEIIFSFENWEKIVIQTKDKILRIETARFLERLSYKKNKEKRVILVDDFHKLKEESQNVILKTIEEPSSSTLFVFVTHKFRKILPTIRSRAIVLKFGFLEKELTFKILKERNFSDFEIDFVLKIYPFQPGKAIKLLEERHFFEYLKKFFQMTSLEKINSLRLKNFPDEDSFFRNLLEILILVYRQDLIEKIKKGSQLSYKDFDKIKELLELYNETEYDFNWDLQLTSFVLNYG